MTTVRTDRVIEDLRRIVEAAEELLRETGTLEQASACCLAS
jgi:ElaB/YqjD/DUF883 family membrane-anchored ribosome-binding protein